MPDFTFENIDDKKFERLVNALGMERIARGLRIFGSGTDGGREATYEGKMDYPSAAAPWDGYLVVQCKQKQTRGKTPMDEADWAIGQLNTEMTKYQNAKKKRRIPDYFLFATNAQLSAQLDTGGKDKFVARLKHWTDELGIKDADVWDRDKLNNLLDGSQKIAQRFGLLHDGDTMNYIAQSVLAHREGVATTLSVFLQEELRIDQFVNLAQAGHTNDDRPPLSRVFVDLRASEQQGPREGFYVVKIIQQESDRPIYPTLIAQEQSAIADSLLKDERDEATPIDINEEQGLFPPSAFQQSLEGTEPEEIEAAEPNYVPLWTNPSRFVIVGGPGQGKSTLAQHLAQRHRAALLKCASVAESLEPETTRILRVIEDGANASGVGLPIHPRWPFLIILEQFADALAKGQVESVLDYIAARVRKRTRREFDASDAEQLLATTAWFVAFDGLDEVPAVSNRREVLDAVRRFLTEARAKDADLLVIATTRPQGYEDDFKESKFNHLNLKPLTIEEALVYANKFVTAKYAEDADRQARIMRHLESASQEDATARLMESPLQVTIMAALVDLVGNPPRERYELFLRYYDVIYQREQERGLALSRVLADHKSDIKILHDRIGLLLQVEAESKGKTESRISRERLERIVHDYLVAKEFTGEMLERTKKNFMDVAFHRLVFLVVAEDGWYEFEVRSLQEFSAARALMRGNYKALKVRLRAIAPVPYWRNTMLFAVGSAFYEQNEDQCDMVMKLCQELNDDDSEVILTRTLAGSRLALDVIEDGIVDSQPRDRRLFFEAALQFLYLPHKKTAERLGEVYGAEDEERYKAAIRSAAASKSAKVPEALFAVLVALNKRVDSPAWAWLLLKELWPVQLEEQQLLLEQMGAGDLWWDDTWTEEMVVQVARESPLYWVSRYLSRLNHSIKWIQDSSTLNNVRAKRSVMKSDGAKLVYHLKASAVKSEMLDRLVQANPVHETWRPFLVGRDFFLLPSADTMAGLLEALAEHFEVDKFYPGLPWQLDGLVHFSKSSGELLNYAQRIRAGEFGSTQEWAAAEARWAAHGFDIDDLLAFSDADWPFSAEIATRGIITHASYNFDDEEDKGHVGANLLLQAFAAMPSERSRRAVAVNLLYLFSSFYNEHDPLRISLTTLLELVIAAKWQVEIFEVLSVIDPDTDWSEETASLDQMGMRMGAIGSDNDVHSLVFQRAKGWVPTFTTMLGKRPVREGILRVLAALAANRVGVPVPPIEGSGLSPEGKISLLTIQLFNGPILLASGEAKERAQQIVDVWDVKNEGGYFEMQRVVGHLIRQPTLFHHQIAVLDKLYESLVIDGRIKHQIIESFMSKLQYRTSGLDNPARRGELAMDWLFESLENEI